MKATKTSVKWRQALGSLFSRDPKVRGIEEKFIARMAASVLTPPKKQSQEERLARGLGQGLFDKALARVIKLCQKAEDEQFDKIQSFSFKRLKLFSHSLLGKPKS